MSRSFRLWALLFSAAAFSCNADPDTDPDDGDGDGGDTFCAIADGGADEMCYTVDDGDENRVVEVADATSPYGADPIATAFYDTSEGKSYVVSGSGAGDIYVDGPPFDSMLLVNFAGTDTGTFSIANGDTVEAFMVSGSSAYLGHPDATGSAVSITVETYDVGGRAKGTFDLTLCAETGDAPDCTNTLHVQGRFNMAREVDDWGEGCTADADAAGADVLCYTVNKGTVTFTEADDVTNPFGFDPGAVAFYNPISDGGSIAGAAGFVDAADPPFAHLLNIDFVGSGIGNYSISGQTLRRFGLLVQGTTYVAGMPEQPADPAIGEASLTITTWDAVGGRVKGTYSASLCPVDPVNGPECDGPRLSIQGAFDVTREADGWIPDCHMSGDGTDELCYSLSSDNDGPATLVREVASTDNPYGFDPGVIAFFNSDAGRLNMAMAETYVDFLSQPSFAHMVSVEVVASSAGVYSIDNSDDLAIFAVKDGVRYIAHADAVGSRAAVAIQNYGAPGERIQAIFEGELCVEGGSGPDCGTTMRIRGVIDTLREPDDWRTTCVADATAAGADTLCYTAEGALGSFVEADSAGAIPWDPAVLAWYDPYGDFTNIVGASGFNAAGDPPFAELLEMRFGGQGTGTYAIADGTLGRVEFIRDGIRFAAFPGDGSPDVGDGEVTVTAWGAEGEAVVGTYRVHLCRETVDVPDCDNGIRLAGSFDLTRERDNFPATCSVGTGVLAADEFCHSADGQVITWVEAASSAPENYLGNDPIVFGAFNGFDATEIAAAANVDTSVEPIAQAFISFAIAADPTAGDATGSYTFSGGTLDGVNAYMDGIEWGYDETSGAPAEVVITSYGAVGEPIEGTFFFALNAKNPDGNFDPDTRRMVGGAFNTTREFDGFLPECQVDAAAAIADVGCLRIEGGPRLHVAEVLDAANPYGGAPAVIGSVMGGGNGFAAFGNGYTGAIWPTAFTETFSVQFAGTTPGAYSTADCETTPAACLPSVDIEYNDGSGPARYQVYWDEGTSTAYGGARMVVPEFGAIGERIRVYVRGQACLDTAVGLDCGTTIDFNAAIDTTRDEDDWHGACSVSGAASEVCFVSEGAQVHWVAQAAANPFGFDPAAFGVFNITDNQTLIAAGKGYNIVLDPPFQRVLSMEVPGASIGSFTITDGARVGFNYDALSYAANDLAIGSDIQININSYGAQGGTITGDYNVTLCLITDSGPPEVYDCDESIRLEGQFDVIRDTDIP